MPGKTKAVGKDWDQHPRHRQSARQLSGHCGQKATRIAIKAQQDETRRSDTTRAMIETAVKFHLDASIKVTLKGMEGEYRLYHLACGLAACRQLNGGGSKKPRSEPGLSRIIAAHLIAEYRL